MEGIIDLEVSTAQNSNVGHMFLKTQGGVCYNSYMCTLRKKSFARINCCGLFSDILQNKISWSGHSWKSDKVNLRGLWLVHFFRILHCSFQDRIRKSITLVHRIDDQGCSLRCYPAKDSFRINFICIFYLQGCVSPGKGDKWYLKCIWIRAVLFFARTWIRAF